MVTASPRSSFVTLQPFGVCPAVAYAAPTAGPDASGESAAPGVRKKPPPVATCPGAHVAEADAPLPEAVAVTTVAAAAMPDGPVAPVGPVSPVGPAGPVSPVVPVPVAPVGPVGPV